MLNRPLILLVEDDADLASLYMEMLMLEGMEVVHFPCCDEAEQWLANATYPPNLIILDLSLPDGNGLDLCRALNDSMESCPHTPILILTANDNPRMPRLCQEAGARAYLDKLSGLDRMVDTVQSLI